MFVVYKCTILGNFDQSFKVNFWMIFREILRKSSRVEETPIPYPSLNLSQGTETGKRVSGWSDHHSQASLCLKEMTDFII